MVIEVKTIRRTIPFIVICLVSSLFISNVNLSVSLPVHTTAHVIHASPLLSSVHIQGGKSINPRIPKPPPKETIAIIVQNSLYPSISSNVTQYRQDLNNSGYETILYTKPISTHQELKGNLTLWYNTYNLTGAVLIGRLPYAQYYHPASTNFAAETFICDLYLMDLDGNWWDINPTDGIYDKHNASAGADIYPEIFIGRIDPQCLTWDTPANFINTYLKRVHEYRLGGVQRQHSALVYIDDDWTGYWGNRWYNDVGLAYSNRTLVDLPTSWTNGTDWLNRITQNYQWTHICVHSTATQHWFGPGGSGSEGIISSNPQIRNAPPSFNFYNLFACHGSQWTTADCLGTTYAFSGSYSLGVVGSTKTGGMMDCDFFYGPLGNNKTLGESLMLWMCNSLNPSSSAGNEYLEWYYGMNIIGDPFLTIHYDCTVLPVVVSSSTHPDPSQWYANAMPQFNWSVPVDVNGIVGYYYVIDQNPNTVPDPQTATYTTLNGTQPSTPLSDGTWYLHVVAKDGAGNVGKTAAHYQINIDTTGPTTSITSPTNNYNSSSSNLTLTWTAQDPRSGYNHSQVWLDTTSNLIYKGQATSLTLTALTEGTHTINVTTYDKLGNTNSQQITVHIDLTNPLLTIISPANGSSTTSTTVQLSWSVSDGQTGYHYAEVRLDGTLTATVQNTSITLYGLTTGTHTLNVTAYDWSGRHTSNHITITIQTTTTTTTTTTSTPPIPGFPWEGLLLGLAVAIMAVLILRRRRH